jgi:hypothetical protein
VGLGKYLERVVDEELAEARAHAEQKDVPHDLGVSAEADVRSKVEEVGGGEETDLMVKRVAGTVSPVTSTPAPMYSTAHTLE